MLASVVLMLRVVLSSLGLIVRWLWCVCVYCVCVVVVVVVAVVVVVVVVGGGGGVWLLSWWM